MSNSEVSGAAPVAVAAPDDDRASAPPWWVAGGAAATGLAGALAATVAGLCCVGPVTFALLGAGGAVAAAGLKPYRLSLLVLSGILVGVGFWQTHRAAATTGACPVRVGRIVRAGLWTAAVLWIAAATLLLVD